jgi:hypothetical protein
LIILNNKTISVKDGGFYSYVVTTPCCMVRSSGPKKTQTEYIKRVFILPFFGLLCLCLLLAEAA